MPTNMIRMTLQVNAVSKSFGSLEALKPLSVDFQSGEIHAVVGENGAGKSTLMNLIGGFLSPSTGSILLNNQPIPNGSPRNCRRLGISMVHQHFMLVPEFTLKQNIDLSLLGLGEGSFSDIQGESDKFGWQIPWEKKVSEVSVGIQQRVEILKSLAGSPKVVIFDEPTAVLSEEEVTELFALLRRPHKNRSVKRSRFRTVNRMDGRRKTFSLSSHSSQLTLPRLRSKRHCIISSEKRRNSRHRRS